MQQFEQTTSTHIKGTMYGMIKWAEGPWAEIHIHWRTWGVVSARITQSMKMLTAQSNFIVLHPGICLNCTEQRILRRTWD